MTLKLDENQQKAVEHFEGPALVVAGPGRGKTTVIMERILHLIREHNVGPEHILAIAFTNAAVDEMEERISDKLVSNNGSPKFRTLHGFGMDIITDNDNYRRAGFSFPPARWGGEIKPIFEQEKKQLERNASDAIVAIYKIQSQTTGKCYIGQSIDPTRRKKQHFRNSSNSRLRQAIRKEGRSQFIFEVIEEVRGIEANERESYWMERYRNSEGVFNYSNPLVQQYSDQLLRELFYRFFNAHGAEDFKRTLEKVMKEKSKVETGLFVPSTINDDRVRTFAEKYEAARQKTDAVDYQDMLIYSAYLLENNPTLRQYYSDKYRYVFIDEFQDISQADFRLISQLSENLFAVGDDDQAIYGFRGGNSEIMQEFANQRNVKKYEITRNYRSTSSIVEHSKTLIEHNPFRIRKNLYTEKPYTTPIKVLETTEETAKSTFLREVESILLEDPVEIQKIGIPVRYRSEVEKLLQMFCSNGFTEIKGDKQREHGDPFKVIGKSKAKIIEGSTIHSMKGKEYDKVILVHNTLGADFPFRNSDNMAEERRVFYVAMTRAKQELIVLGGNCQFISEFQNAPPTKEELEEVFKAELAAREPKFKAKLEESSKAALEALEPRIRRELEEATKIERKQHEHEIKRLQSTITKSQNEAKKLKLTFPQRLKSTKGVFLKGLIPLLDEFESQINSLPATVESNGESDDFAAFGEKVQLAHTQLLNLVKDYELKPIEASLGTIFNPAYHEKLSPAIHSDEVPIDRVIKEELRGYLLHGRVIRKAQVVVSKGRSIWTPEELDDKPTRRKKPETKSALSVAKRKQYEKKHGIATKPKFTADRRFNLEAIDFDYLTHETGVDTNTLFLIFKKLNNNEYPDDIAEDLNIEKDIIYDLNDGVYFVSDLG